MWDKKRGRGSMKKGREGKLLGKEGEVEGGKEGGNANFYSFLTSSFFILLILFVLSFT